MRPFPSFADGFHRALECLQGFCYSLFVAVVPIVVKGSNKFIGWTVKTAGVQKSERRSHNFSMGKLRIEANEYPIGVLVSNPVFPEAMIQFLNGAIGVLRDFSLTCRILIHFPDSTVDNAKRKLNYIEDSRSIGLKYELLA